ncbi:MAG: DUF3786 domain-containing protein [Pirellulaceae bacterium]|nr:DUF3786 domain-containing protein [Pirellulaceae bacterium]
MSRTSSPMEILKLLDKSNCRKCGKPTCMAFAVAVFNGQKQLAECPMLEGSVVEQYHGSVARHVPLDQDLNVTIERLKKGIAAIDLPSSARRLGATFADEKLTMKCLGRDFSVDAAGNITTGLHVHGWIVVPALNYVIDGAGTPLSGDWVSYRQLEAGQARYPLFAQMCEKPCQKLADADTDLFEDVLSLFGSPIDNCHSSDLSFVFYPLPRVPILIRYWKAEDGLESNLSFLFDSTTTENLNIESVYLLGTGLVIMFEKIALKHGLQLP